MDLIKTIWLSDMRFNLKFTKYFWQELGHKEARTGGAGRSHNQYQLSHIQIMVYNIRVGMS